ncbi:helix-turn-helix domain-containing protein [Pontibacter pamirensis]|uniref:helix-turn-helix domain-containing protein n=1 Tax=Pontibacter pamirensis TaxID=2562824 RepID=UPI00138A2BB3|nr:helix-turn-helix transcriptional regulator [Pontibacter pamirensis]
MTIQTTFGGRLRSFRRHKNLTGDELGDIFGVGKARVSGIENDKWGATLESCLRLWAAFPDLNLDWLLTGRGGMLYVEEHVRLAFLQAEQEKLQMEKDKLQEEKGRLQAVKDQLEAARSKAEALEGLLTRHGIMVPKHKGGSR